MLPVQKKSKMRKRTRRSHHALTALNRATCPKCGDPKLPHCACSNCGYASRKVNLPLNNEEV